MLVSLIRSDVSSISTKIAASFSAREKVWNYGIENRCVSNNTKRVYYLSNIFMRNKRFTVTYAQDILLYLEYLHW